MSEADNNRGPGDAPEAPRPAAPKPPSKTIVGVGITPPPPPGAPLAPPAPAAAASATFAKPQGPLAPPPPLAASANVPKPPPPTAAGQSAAAKAPTPSTAGKAPARSGGAIAMPMEHAAPEPARVPATSAPTPAPVTASALKTGEFTRDQVLAAAASRKTSGDPARATGGSRSTGEFNRSTLFDLDAPTTGTARRPLTLSEPEAAAEPAPAARSLFDLDEPATGTMRQVPPAAAKPKAVPAPARAPLPAPAPTPAPVETPEPRLSAVDMLFTSSAAPAQGSIGATAPLAPAPAAAAQAASAAAEGTRPAAARRTWGDGTTDTMPVLAALAREAGEENSSLDELAELGQTGERSKTVEILVDALRAPEIVSPGQTGASPVVAHREDSFDVTLVIPKPGDGAEDRKARLLSRIKTTRSMFRLLGYLDVTDEERKECLALFTEYEARLKTLTGTQAEKKDLVALHRAVPPEALDELEKLVTRIEERLLALDEYVPRDKFRARITKEKHAPKLLLRYARGLASRRFAVGFRRDRFEHLVNELLTAPAGDGRLRLLPREKARPVLLQILTGTNSTNQESDRESAVAYLRESLERLATIATQDEFFESGFFLDVHGYKISMRDQITSPEFLYLAIALNVEIHNRIEGWIADLERLHKANQLTQDGPPREFLEGKLREQEEAVQSVFSTFRHTKERTSAVAVDARVSQEGKQAKKDAPRASARKPQKKREEDLSLEDLGRRQLIKFAVVTLVAVVSLGYVMTSTGVITVSEPSARWLTDAELAQLPPILVSGILRDKVRVEGTTNKHWKELSARERTDMADALAKKLAAMNVTSAEVKDYKTLAIRIEQGLVSEVDTASAPKK